MKTEEMVAKSQNVESKRGIKEILQSYGPGIIAVLAWLGAGDLVTSSVAGADYGYSLMWVLALSLLLRFLIVNIIARFQLYNHEGLSILEGYGRLHPFFAYFLFVYALIMGHLFNAYMIKGAGQALSTLLHLNQPLLCSIIVVIAALLLIGKNLYSRIENVMKALLALMTFAFFILAIQAKPDLIGIVKGTVGFSIPDDTGIHGALLVAVSIIGAVAGSIANFVHPYFMKEKGWVKPEHKKKQRNDLLFAICMAIIINLAIWVVGAEILKPNGIKVDSIDDLGKALQLNFGFAGWLIFYVGVFATLFASVIGKSTGFPNLITDAFQIITKGRKEKYGPEFKKDPMHKWFMLFILITPIIWSVPGMPGFISLVVGVNALNIVGFPVIALGLLFLSNNKKLLGPARNNWFENLLLLAATILAVWSSVQLAMDLFAK